MDMQLITQVWDSRQGRYVEDELSLWDALPSWQREALRALQDAFPGSEWVLGPDEDSAGLDGDPERGASAA